MKNRFPFGAGMALVLAAILVAPLCCFAQENTKTLEEVLEIARKRAPLILSARARIEEAKGRLAGASIRLQQNPVFEANGGPRFSPGSKTTSLDVALSQ